jgi:hypothetical protein
MGNSAYLLTLCVLAESAVTSVALAYAMRLMSRFLRVESLRRSRLLGAAILCGAVLFVCLLIGQFFYFAMLLISTLVFAIWFVVKGVRSVYGPRPDIGWITYFSWPITSSIALLCLYLLLITWKVIGLVFQLFGSHEMLLAGNAVWAYLFGLHADAVFPALTFFFIMLSVLLRAQLWRVFVLWTVSAAVLRIAIGLCDLLLSRMSTA